MKPADFIATAKDLIQASTRGRPRETSLRRAVSTTYYAPDGDFYKDAVVQYVADAEYQISRFTKVPLKDRRAFAVYVLMDMRTD